MMGGGMETAPFLLTGNQRSGTTFTARLIGLHPRAAFGYEEGVIRMAAAWFTAMAGADGRGLPYARYQEFARALEVREGERWSAARHSVEGIFLRWQEDGTLQRLARAQDVGAFVRRLCWEHHCGGREPAPLLWGDKYPEFLFLLDPLARIFPQARWIFVARRPEANVEALARKLAPQAGRVRGKAVFTLADCAQQWVDWNQAWLDFRARIPAERRLELRYEDWIARPQEVANQLGSFLGINLLAEPACQRELARLDPGRAERWRSAPEAEEIERLCRAPVFDKILGQFGYAAAARGLSGPV